MTTHFARILPILIVAAIAGANEATPAQTTPKSALRMENASDAFPLSLQGFFGKGEKTEASLRDKTTGKSVWLKPGETLGEWKLESADAESGRAVLSAGKRRVTLRQAGEIQSEPAPGISQDSKEEKPNAPGLKSIKDSVFAKKFEEQMMDKKFGVIVQRLGKESEETLRKSHPEYFKESGGFDQKKPGAIIAQAAEMKRLLGADSNPETDALRPTLTTLFDAVERAKPYASEKPLSSQTTPPGSADSSHDDPEMLRVFEEADRLHLERNGAQK